MVRKGATGLARAIRRAAGVVAAVAAILLSIGPLRAQQDPQALTEQAIHRLDLQTELLRQPETVEASLQLPPETLWVGVIVGLAVLFYAFRDMIPAFRLGRGGAWTEAEDGAAGSGARTPEIVLNAADELAAQGRFVEAMHALLLQALAEIRRRLDQEFAVSMTSREILRSTQVSEALRRPLRDVVNRVEWTYFGGHAAVRDDYLVCRASFAALARALQRGAAA
jgi:hypothetical protein